MAFDQENYWMVLAFEDGFEVPKIIRLLKRDEAQDETEAIRKGFLLASKKVDIDPAQCRFAAFFNDGSDEIREQGRAMCEALVRVGVPNKREALEKCALLLGAKLLFLKKQAFSRRLRKLTGICH